MKKLLNSKYNNALCNIKSKEIFLLFYFLLFVFGISNSISYNFYHEFRIIEVGLLLSYMFFSLFNKKWYISNIELIFFFFLIIGSLYWSYPLFIIVDLLLFYLLYKIFKILDYNEWITKIIVLSSLTIFLMLPLAVWDYLTTGIYAQNWYPLPWNIRVYNSYFLVISIFTAWLYLTEIKLKYLYLFILYLSFLSILLDNGRSATLAYSVFMSILVIYNRSDRSRLIITYSASWISYIFITYLSTLNVSDSSTSGLQIVRMTSSLRFNLWNNAYECWLEHPIIGCGFYQMDTYPRLAAHPHNLFIQVLTETGLIGFGFLTVIIVTILKYIDWNFKKNYFVLAALFSISIDMSLSGIHIYPITQISLLWLFVFLLKNPIFYHSYHFVDILTVERKYDKYISIIVFIVITVLFIFIFINTTIFSLDTPSTPPRFWGYGYQLIQ